MLCSIEESTHRGLQWKDSMNLIRNKWKRDFSFVIQWWVLWIFSLSLSFCFFIFNNSGTNHTFSMRSQQFPSWISVLDKKLFSTPFPTKNGSSRRDRESLPYLACNSSDKCSSQSSVLLFPLMPKELRIWSLIQLLPSAACVFLVPLRSSIQDMKVRETQSNQPQGQQPAEWCSFCHLGSLKD